MATITKTHKQSTQPLSPLRLRPDSAEAQSLADFKNALLIVSLVINLALLISYMVIRLS